MGNYDRDFQWRMIQPHNSYSYTPYTNTSTCNPRTDGDARQMVNSNTYFLDDRTHTSNMKRPSIVPTTRTPDYPLSVPQPPPPSLYSAYEHPTTSQPSVSEPGWEYTSPLRRCHTPNTSTPYLPLHPSAPSSSSSLPSPTALLNRPSLSLSSPSVMYGGMVEPLLSDYSTNSFYPVWNGAGTSGIGEPDTSTPTDFNGLGSLPSVSVTATTSLDPVMGERNGGEEEEMKMEYPPLAALNQGDLDYIYGSMDTIPSSSTGSSHLRDGQPSQRYYYPMMDRYKREHSPTVSPAHSNNNNGLSIPSSSGFRNLARNSGSFELNKRAQGPSTASSVDGSTTTNAHKRPRSRQCDFPGCVNRARSHQKCKKHGGAHVCEHEGCTKNSQSRGLCIAHGGGSRCKVDGCTRASQSKGLCKSHGGGEYCAVENCRKKAHLKHLCRNHGGGVRCKNPKCIKWAQRKGWCMAHSKEVFGH